MSITNEYKLAFFSDLLYDNVGSQMKREDWKVIDTWVTGIMNDWNVQEDMNIDGTLFYVCESTMLERFEAVKEYLPGVYAELEAAMDLADELDSDDSVRLLDSDSTLTSLADMFGVWRTMIAAT